MQNKLAKIRLLLEDKNLAGYIIPSNDEYMSEFTPPAFRRLEYITGFTGSNGLVVILQNTALFFTDGRYLTQSKVELDAKSYQIFDIADIGKFNWSNYVREADIIAYDPKIFTKHQLAYFKPVQLEATDENLVDDIWVWDNRPALPSSIPYQYDVKYSGESAESKIAKCRELLKEQSADAMVITNADSTCWLLNIRACDLEYSPIFLAFTVITKDDVIVSRCHYGEDANKIKAVLQNLGYQFIADLDRVIDNIDGKILYDMNSCSSYLIDLLSRKGAVHLPDPCQLWKAKKNNVEIQYMIETHIIDAVSVCETLAFIANHPNIGALSEYDISEILTQNRAKSKLYKTDSFPAICGYQDNGAVIHYRAKKDTAKKLSPSGLLLIDSGGQYLGGTTDITRTVHLGSRINPKYKHHYTLVLKCHIALATIKFPENKVTGGNLDVLARQYLWAEGKDYAHSPGHGVGAFMNVHEGPQAISPKSFNAVLQEGMVLSNEPGYYVEGEYGIRIENLIYVQSSNGYCNFEQLTLVPYAKDLIDFDMLNDTEMEYLKKYYDEINNKVYSHMSSEAKTWLKQEMRLC